MRRQHFTDSPLIRAWQNGALSRYGVSTVLNHLKITIVDMFSAIIPFTRSLGGATSTNDERSCSSAPKQRRKSLNYTLYLTPYSYFFAEFPRPWVILNAATRPVLSRLTTTTLFRLAACLVFRGETQRIRTTMLHEACKRRSFGFASQGVSGQRKARLTKKEILPVRLPSYPITRHPRRQRTP